MLDSLLEIELAYKIIKSEEEDKDAQQKDPFDVHYERLRCAMDVGCLTTISLRYGVAGGSARLRGVQDDREIRDEHPRSHA